MRSCDQESVIGVNASLAESFKEWVRVENVDLRNYLTERGMDWRKARIAATKYRTVVVDENGGTRCV